MVMRRSRAQNGDLFLRYTHEQVTEETTNA